MECKELCKGYQHEKFQLSVQKWFHRHLLCPATLDYRLKKNLDTFDLTNQKPFQTPFFCRRAKLA